MTTHPAPATQPPISTSTVYGSTDAAVLREQLDGLGALPSWHQASRLGVELVDHPDTAEGVLHLANGDVVYPTAGGWATLDDARTGTYVKSGKMARIHNPGIDVESRIHPTAVIDPTARIEAGAVVGPNARVGRHAHVGKDAHVSQQAQLGDGCFVGSGATLRPATVLGEGAVIGAGADIGSCTRVGAGAHVTQGTVVDAHQIVAAGSTTSPASQRRHDRQQQSRVGQITHAVERLLAMDRE